MLHFNSTLTQTLIITCAVGVAACADPPPEPAPAPPVVIDASYDLTADFSQYESFDVIEPADFDDGEAPPSYTQRNRRTVEEAIIDEMLARGYAYDETNPDLRISPFVRLDEVEVVEELWWWDSYWGWYWGYATPWYDRDIVDLEAGTLVVDVVALGDPEEDTDDELVFRGTARALFWGTPSDDPDGILIAIDNIFDYWPVEEAL